MSKQGAIFALVVDCNNFYASCERVFRPELKRHPVVVLSNNDGCIIARSEEAKRIGITMGVPVHQIQHLIKKHQVAVFSPNFTLYGDFSNRVMQVLGDFTPDVEIYSIDEAFLGLGGLLIKDYTQFGVEMKERVSKWTGIPISVGIGPTKTLAKVANRYIKDTNKDFGVLDLTDPDLREEILPEIAIQDVWGIGRRIAIRLQDYGIYNAWDLSHAPDGWIQKEFGITGLRTVQELRGYPCQNIETLVAGKKHIASTRSFGKAITTLDQLEEAVSSYTSRAAEKLRAQGSAAGYVYVFIHTNPHRGGKQYKGHKVLELPTPSASTLELIHYALKALRRVYNKGFSYKKAGVILGGIVPLNQVQHNLFDHTDKEKQLKLSETVDRINTWMNKGAVIYAAEGTMQVWKMRANYLSPQYTTRWDDLLKVK